jgi:hypothetical protein
MVTILPRVVRRAPARDEVFDMRRKVGQNLRSHHNDEYEGSRVDGEAKITG